MYIYVMLGISDVLLGTRSLAALGQPPWLTFVFCQTHTTNWPRPLSSQRLYERKLYTQTYMMLEVKAGQGGDCQTIKI